MNVIQGSYNNNPLSSPIEDIGFIQIYWNDIQNRPEFTNIFRNILSNTTSNIADYNEIYAKV
jgi:hypothetical protein